MTSSRAIFSCMTAALLWSCAQEPVAPLRQVPAPPAHPVSAAASSAASLPQVTPELSIDSFRSMPLIGTGFTLEDTLTTTAAYTRYAIGYASNGLYISGILNLPKGEGPFPLAVLNHGHIPPSIYTRGRGLKREQDWLASRGFAVLHSDYRGHGESDESPDIRDTYDGALEYSMDVVNGVQALCATDLPVNCDDITMLGHSMGGGITLNIAVAFPDLADRIVLYAPVSGQAWKNFDRWRRERDTEDITEKNLGTPDTNPAAWAALSSWTQFDRIRIPVLVVHGDQDADVPKDWSDELVTELKRLGKDVEYLELTGEQHEFINKWPAFMNAILAFINAHAS